MQRDKKERDCQTPLCNIKQDRGKMFIILLLSFTGYILSLARRCSHHFLSLNWLANDTKMYIWPSFLTFLIRVLIRQCYKIQKSWFNSRMVEILLYYANGYPSCFSELSSSDIQSGNLELIITTNIHKVVIPGCWCFEFSGGGCLFWAAKAYFCLLYCSYV